MIRSRIFAAAAGFAALMLAPQPLAAQTEAEEMEQAMAMLSGMFPAEPLTSEQDARLPQAQRIIARMIPEGTLSEMMGSTFDQMLGPIMNAAGSPSIGTVTEATGLTTVDLDLTEEQSDELAAIFDPAWEERQQREMGLLPQMMGQMMNAMEPGMRKAMAELYAINFTQAELNEIEAFFLTETGANFARKSFTMSSDPRIISATMEAMPTIMGTLTSMEQSMTEVAADLPSKRSFAELSSAERARVAELTGYSAEEIAAALADSDSE